MFKFISKKLKKNNKGFTLVELVAVLAILGIIGAIAVPRIAATRKNAAKMAHEANVRILENAANMYITEKGIPSGGKEWTKSDKADWQDYLQDWPEIPKGLTDSDFADGEGEEVVDKENYKVVIGSNGTIKVTPQLIGEEQPEEEQPGNEPNE